MRTRQPSRSVPAPIAAKLRAVGRRLLWAGFARAVFLTAALCLAGMLAAMALDWWLVLFSGTARFVLTAATLTLTLVLAVTWGLRPLFRARRTVALAQRIEQSTPELQERWSTVTELAESEDPDEVRGAQRLIDQVTNEAVSLNHLVRIGTATRIPSLRTWFYAAAVAGLALFFFTWFWPNESRVLLQRYWQPFGNVSLTHVHSLTGNAVLAEGEPILLEASTEGRYASRALLTINRNGERETIPLEPATRDGRRFTWKIRAVDEPFHYRFRANDDQTEWHEVRVGVRPEIEEMFVRLTPPAYTGEPVDERPSLPRRARALYGTWLDIEVKPDTAVTSLALRQEEDAAKADPFALKPNDEGWYAHRILLTEDLEFSVVLETVEGLTNNNAPRCEIQVYEDTPPWVQIQSPDAEMAVRPDDTIEVEFIARDDLGIATAELVLNIYDGVADRTVTIPIDLGNQKGGTEVEQSVPLNLAELGLSDEAMLEYSVAVADTRDFSAESYANQINNPNSRQQANAQQSGQQQSGQQQSGPQQQGDQQTSNQKSGDQPDQQSGDQQSGDQQQGDSEQLAANDPQQSQSSQQQKQQQQQSPGGNPPPGDDMTRRTLNLAQKGTACSACQKLIVDKWSGSFEGQQREKLQIAIEEYIAELDALLEKAESVAAGLDRHLSATDTWDNPEVEATNLARRFLAEGVGVIENLRTEAEGTPYAFMSLQLGNITSSYVEPAGEYLTVILPLEMDADKRRRNLNAAQYNISQARKRLASSTEQYETVKREKELEDLVNRVAEMHRIFIEDSQKLLDQSGEGDGYGDLGNQLPGMMYEVSAEYAEKVREYMEKMKELEKQLAEALAQDPDLLRRYLASKQKSARTIRDQLSILAIRQQEIQDRVHDWVAAAGEGEEVFLAELRSVQYQDQQQWIRDADQLHEDILTWKPRELDPKKGHLRDALELSQKIALDARETLTVYNGGDVDETLRRAEELMSDIGDLELLLSELIADASFNFTAPAFVERRLVQTEDLLLREETWMEKIRSLEEGELGLAAALDEIRLAYDTTIFIEKIERLGPATEAMGEEAKRLARLLEGTMKAMVLENQIAMVESLEQEKLPRGRDHGEVTVEGFARAEEYFDDLLALMQEHANENFTPPESFAGQVPSLEDLLAKLEQEMDACEALGLSCPRPNIDLVMDWVLPQNQQGSGMGQGKGQGQGQGKGSGQPQQQQHPSQQQQQQQQNQKNQQNQQQNPGQQPQQNQGQQQQQQQQQQQDGRGSSPAEQRLAQARARLAQQRAEEAAKELEETRKQLAERGEKAAIAAGEEEMEEGPIDFDLPPLPEMKDEREWNTFVSELEDELRQGRDTTPPESYRTAIDEYFRALSELASEN